MQASLARCDTASGDRVDLLLLLQTPRRVSRLPAHCPRGSISATRVFLRSGLLLTALRQANPPGDGSAAQQPSLLSKVNDQANGPVMLELDAGVEAGSHLTAVVSVGWGGLEWGWG
jgi:hypothetical protein